MKFNSTLLLMLVSAAFGISACKKDKSEPDYSNCQLYKAEYTSGSKESYKPYV